MRNGLLIVAAILIMTESSSAQGTTGTPQTPAPATNSVMKLDDATPVLLRTKEALSSASARVGDRVPFRVTEDVRVGGLVVIHRGAQAWGVVTAVQPKRRKGRAGSLDVAIQSVQLLSGDRAALRAQEHSKGVGKTGQILAEMLPDDQIWGLSLPLRPLFLLQKGEDALLPAGTKFTAYLNGDVSLERTAFEWVQPVIAQRTGPATVTIFRTAFPARGAFRPSVYCGQIALARLPQDGYFKIQLPPGKYFFRSNDEQLLELHLEEGQDVYIQMQIITHGFSVKGHLRQVSNSEGEDEVANLYELSGKDVAKVSDANLADLEAMPEKK